MSELFDKYKNRIFEELESKGLLDKELIDEFIWLPLVQRREEPLTNYNICVCLKDRKTHEISLFSASDILDIDINKI